MTDPNEFLLRLIENEEKIMLVNTYKGIPVSFPASFVDHHTDEFRVKAHPFQSLCIDINKLTIIQAKGMEQPLMAFAVSVDPADSIVTLKNIRFADVNVGSRRFDRVVPMEHIEIDAENEQGQRISGKINDISEQGMGFKTRDTVDAQPGDKLLFSFKLIDQDEVFVFDQLQGEIKNKIRDDISGSTRIGAALHPDENQDERLKRYVHGRIDMINQELQLLMPAVI